MPDIVITAPPPPTPRLCNAKNMRIGQLGILQHGPYAGHVVMRICDYVVSLTQPIEDWQVFKNDLQVEVIPSGSTISFIAP